MSVDLPDPATGSAPIVDTLIARAATADRRVAKFGGMVAAELALPVERRLDDETRSLILADLDRLVAAVVADLRQAGARVTTAPDYGNDDKSLAERLIAAGMIEESGFADELAMRAWSIVIAARLPVSPGEADQPSLLPRLANSPDRLIAGAASAMMAAQARRRSGGIDAGRDDLPAELQHCLIWWVAAAMAASGADETAVVEGARRALAAHDEGARLEATAERLVAAIEPDQDALTDLLGEALDDRNPPLIAAVIARGLAIDPSAARAMLADSADDRLWLALRALDLPRDLVARFGLALCTADRRRKEQDFADLLDPLMALSPQAASAALAGLRLPKAYRLARSVFDQ